MDCCILTATCLKQLSPKFFYIALVHVLTLNTKAVCDGYLPLTARRQHPTLQSRDRRVHLQAIRLLSDLTACEFIPFTLDLTLQKQNA